MTLDEAREILAQKARFDRLMDRFDKAVANLIGANLPEERAS